MAETQPMMLQELCYTAADFRLQLNSIVCEEGVSDVAGGSLLVTTGGDGLDLFVAEGAAFINSDSADQGIYSVYNDAQATVTATTADGTNPRIDQVIATVNDSQISGTDDDWVLSVLAGTPTGGATLANLNGAAALPDRSIRLAYVLVPASFAGPFVNATHILDVRNPYGECGGQPWVSLEASASTSIANNTHTQITLATTAHLDRPFFTVSGSTITVLQAGMYDISAMAAFAGVGSVGTTRWFSVLRNNTNLPNLNPTGQYVGGERISHDSGEAATSLYTSFGRQMIALAANDTVKLAAYQDTGGAINTLHQGASPEMFVAHLTVRKVG